VLRRAGTIREANEGVLKRNQAPLEAQTSALRSQLDAIHTRLGPSPANSAELERELKALTLD
jgi:hypothetical protein